MIKQKSNLVNFLLIVLIITLLGITAKYIWLPFIKNTLIYDKAYKAYQDNRWLTFNSERAKFSFRHPLGWPVSAVDFKTKNGMYTYLAKDGIIEYIDFEEEFSNQAGGLSLGFITVEKTNYKDLKEYVDDISQEKMVDMLVKGRTQKVTIKPPIIEYLKIGGEDAISLTDTNTMASFSNQTADYQFIRNGWLYRFATTDSSRFLENKAKNTETFQKMILSIKFLD